MSGITLSKAVRSNLLNLQSTADLLAQAQERLSTGLRVNSAIDSPNNFFTARNLTSRANDLGQLLDSVSTAIQTVKAADTGITSITKLVESAQATARQALQTSATIGGSTARASTSDTSGLVIAAGTAAGPAIITGGSYTYTNTVASTGVSDGDEATFQAGSGTVYHVVFHNGGLYPGDSTHIGFDFSSGGQIQDFFDGLAAAMGYLAAQNSDTDFDGMVVDTSTSTPTISLGTNTSDALTIGGAWPSAMGFAGTANPTSTSPGTAGDVVVNGQTITLADGDGASEILSKFQSAAGASTGLNQFSVTSNGGTLSLAGTNGNDLAISGDAATLAALGLSTTTIDGVAGGTNPKRAELVATYNDILDQITAMAKDSGYNGVNLLNGDSLSVLFNEDGSSKLAVAGQSDDATSLGLDALGSTAFDTNSGINDTMDDLRAAIDSLRVQASKFGSSLSIIQTRREFTTNMIDVLNKGASNLTLADSNNEAANVLALQTRQQLSSTALSLASQADQNVLRLF